MFEETSGIEVWHTELLFRSFLLRLRVIGKRSSARGDGRSPENVPEYGGGFESVGMRSLTEGHLRHQFRDLIWTLD